MLTFVVFVLVFGGMVFLHEFGHFIVSRLFKIQVEEFGFGFPPRLFRFWRAQGSLVIGGKSVRIPANFDLPFEAQDGINEEANATADMVNEHLVLRSIALVRPRDILKASRPAYDDLKLKAEYLPPEKAVVPEPAKPVSVMSQGSIALNGLITEIETGTEFTMNALPLGGFVRPKGENDPTVPGGLAAANPWKRLAVLFAGPLMNLLTAVVVFSIVIAQTGVPVRGTIKIEEVTAGSPAEQAGLQANDAIKAINGTPVSDVDETRRLIRASLDKPLELLIERNGQELTITATPLSSRSAEQGALGIALGYPTRPANLGEAIVGGVTVTGLQAVAIVYLPIGLIQGVIAPDEARLVGLKGIYDLFGSAIQRDTQTREQPSAPQNPQPGSGGNLPAEQPTNYILSLIAMLSISLGVFNLFPIPALDGGRILFTLPEILFRRRIPTHLENAVNGVAMMLLIMLMVFINLMDFVNPVDIKLP
jgi:regulator of sigma E protease